VYVLLGAAAFFSRGGAVVAAQRPDAARRFYGHAVALNPDHEPALARFASLAAAPPAPRPESQALAEQARVAAAAKRYDDARALLREAGRLEPDWALPHQYLANVAFLEGDRREAVRHLERAVQLQPLDAAMRANLKKLRRDAAGV
jgi:tetratricopeptide (TPR) repeat protein